MDLELNQMPVIEKVAIYITEMVPAKVVMLDVGDQCTLAEKSEDISADAESRDTQDLALTQHLIWLLLIWQ